MSRALVPHAYLITAAGQASLNPPQDGNTLQDLKEDVTNNYFEVMPGITMTQTPQKGSLSWLKENCYLISAMMF